MAVDDSDPDVLRESQTHPSRNVVVAGLFDDRGRILMVLTKRFPNHWQPIGGGVRPGDASPRAALRREVLEETSLDIPCDSFHPVLVTPYDFGQGSVRFYTATVPPDARIALDTVELADWGWSTLEAAAGLAMFPATREFIGHLQRQEGTGR